MKEGRRRSKRRSKKEDGRKEILSVGRRGEKHGEEELELELESLSCCHPEPSS